MLRIFIALVLGGTAAAGVTILTRWAPGGVRTEATPSGIPFLLRREDFAGPTKPWLLVVFTASTCDACADVWARARLLASPEVEVQQVEVGEALELHRAYRIDSVPMTVLVDSDGLVRRSFLGPVGGDDLGAAISEVTASAGQ